MDKIFKAANKKINASNDVDMQSPGNTPCGNLTFTKGNNEITPDADDGEKDDDVDEKEGYKTKSSGKRIQRRRGRDWDSPKKESIKKKKKQTKNNSFEMYVIKRPPGYVPEPIYP